MIRNGVSFQRIVRPTLLMPPNSFVFSSCEMTITGSGPKSAFGFQPWPYSNGTSNMGKNVPVVMRVVTGAGFSAPFTPSPEMMPNARYIITACFGTSE